MADQNPIVGSIVAGALAGAVATFLLMNSGVIQESAQQSNTSQEAAPPQSATDYEQAIITTVEAAQDSVVSIVITQDVPVFERIFEESPNLLDPFGGFFRFRTPSLRQRGTEERQIGGGSGFIISEDGLIVTNRHVVDQGEADYTVFLSDGSRHEADVVARDPVNDLAVLQINASGLPFLEFDDSDALQVGQTVIAIGNALGEFSNSVSTGIVSGLGRSIVAGNQAGQSEQIDEVIQTDAAINPGNSGGPLLDLNGRVIGVNVAVALGSENIGFALPSNLVRTVVDSVRETGRIVRPYIGVRYTEITPALQEANNLSVDHGVLIVRGENPQELAVMPGSPADKAGLREGDIILEVDGEELNEDTSLANTIQNKQVGDAITLRILSQGQEKTVQVTLEEFPE